MIILEILLIWLIIKDLIILNENVNKDSNIFLIMWDLIVGMVLKFYVFDYLFLKYVVYVY